MKFFSKKSSKKDRSSIADEVVQDAPEKPKKKSFFSRKEKPEGISIDGAEAVDIEFIETERGVIERVIQKPDAAVGAKKKEKKKQQAPKEKKQKAPKKEKPIKPKKPSFSRKSRFSLLIGDEGAVLVHMKGNKVLSRQFAPDASETNLIELRETIKKDPDAPILLILDSMDQSFSQQSLPPVSSMSVPKLIKRRLNRDFKPEDIKGAIVLGREKSGRKDWSFLMISVDKSPQLVLWLDFIMTFQNRFRGIVLLSVETEVFIKQLERAMGLVRAGAGAQWKMLVSHNKVGGYRQIVLRNGRLVFTRLALPIGEPTPEVIAGNIEQETLNTIEYIKRIGFDPRSGIDVYVISSANVNQLIDPRRFDANQFHAKSPAEIAAYLGIEGATQASDQFGDVILSSAIGGSRKAILKLSTVESRQYDRLQITKYAQRLGTTFLILGLIIYMAYTGYQALLEASNIEDLEQKKRIHQQSLDAMKKKIEDTKLDLDAVMEQYEIYSVLKNEQRTPVPQINRLATLINPPVTVKSMEWKMGDFFRSESAIPGFDGFNMEPIDPNDPAIKDSKVVTIILEVEFPSGLKNPALFKKFSNDFIGKMNKQYPQATLAYTAIPTEYLDRDNLQFNFEQTQNNVLGVAPVPVQVVMRLRIGQAQEAQGDAKGPLADPKDALPPVPGMPPVTGAAPASPLEEGLP